MLRPGQYQFPQTAASSQSVILGGGSLEQANDPNFRDPQAAQWNLTIERQITANTMARISYVGMSSYRLPITIDLNQVAPSTTPYSPSLTPFPNGLLLMSSESEGNAS